MTSTAKPIRVLIADDEPLARRGMEQLLAGHADCRIVAACRNGRDTVRALRASQPDVAFLDIQMPGLGGFDVLHAFEAGTAPVVVFVTAHDEFAVRAFEERALDYLLKPVSQQRFDRALERVRERLQTDHAMRLTRQLASFLGGDAATGVEPSAVNVRSTQCLVIPTATGELVLDAEEIDWIQAEDYCAAVHARGRRHVIRESLTSLERRLDPAGFVRVHRSAIVRLDRVRELRSRGPGGGFVILRDGTRLPVSRRRRERVATLIRTL
jgi:two-component system LytT family response regulator